MKGLIRSELSVVLVLSGFLGGCVSAAPVPVRPAISYALFPGGESGPQIPLRREKDGFTFPDDPEAAAFATERDVTLKAAKACGFDKIVYNQHGPELLFGTGQTADLVYARALLLWCRAYMPGRQAGAVLQVRFETTGDLILSVRSQLQAADGTPLGQETHTLGGYKMITVIYEDARDLMSSLGSRRLSGDDMVDIWCRKAPVNFNYWPSFELREFGQDETLRVRGDTSKLYAASSTTEDCLLGPECRLRFETFNPSTLPPYWVSFAQSRNDYPRPGIDKSTSLLIGNNAFWVIRHGEPRLQHFVERSTIAWRHPCSAKPTAKVIGLETDQRDAFLKGSIKSLDSGWSEADANCKEYTFEMGRHGLDAYSSYYVELGPSKHGSFAMQATQQFMLDGRTFMSARMWIDRNGHAGFRNFCETTIIN